MRKYILLAVIGLLSFSGIDGSTDTPQCEGCKKLVQLLSNITHNLDYKDDMVKLCEEYSFLPGKEAEAWCKKAVDRFFDLINNNMNLDTVCYDIKACTRTLSYNYLHRTKFIPIDKAETGNQNDCDFCMYTAGKIKDIIVGGPTELEIKTHIEDACHTFKSVEQECTQILNEYFDTLFTYLNQTFQPQDLCRSLNMCSPKKTRQLYLFGSLFEMFRINSRAPMSIESIPLINSFDPPTAQQSTPINCIICKKLVKIIQRQLKDNATDQQIINVLNEVCELFPLKDRDNCHQVVTNYSDKLIETLTQDIDPNIACALAGLCVPSRFVNYLNGYYLQRETPKFKSNNVICEECEMIAHYIQNQMYNFKNEEQIESFIKNVMCKKLSYFIREKDCETFVNDYTPLIMQLIAQEVFDPTTLCFKEIKICTNHTESYIKSRKHSNCELCQKLVNRVSSLPPNREVLSANKIVDKVCKSMPKPARVECDFLMRSFGSYFAQSVDREETALDVCRSLDLCIVPGHVHLLGGHKCTYGPSYWCHSEDHANACQASVYCKNNVWAPSD